MRNTSTMRSLYHKAIDQQGPSEKQSNLAMFFSWLITNAFGGVIAYFYAKWSYDLVSIALYLYWGLQFVFVAKTMTLVDFGEVDLPTFRALGKTNPFWPLWRFIWSRRAVESFNANDPKQIFQVIKYEEQTVKSSHEAVLSHIQERRNDLEISKKSLVMILKKRVSSLQEPARDQLEVIRLESAQNCVKKINELLTQLSDQENRAAAGLDKVVKFCAELRDMHRGAHQIYEISRALQVTTRAEEEIPIIEAQLSELSALSNYVIAALQEIDNENAAAGTARIEIDSLTSEEEVQTINVIH